MKEAFNVTKDILIQHSFNKVYYSNINKRKPQIIQHILASNFALDLSCANNFKLKKNIIRIAFQNNFCRELSTFSNNAPIKGFVKKAKVQTIQFALHCFKGPIKPLEKGFLSLPPMLTKRQKPCIFEASKTSAANCPPWFLNFGVKRSSLPYFFKKRGGFDFLTLNLKLNHLCALYKKKKLGQIKKDLFDPLIPDKTVALWPLGFYLREPKKRGLLRLKKPLVFIKVISGVFNKAIKQSSLCNLKTRNSGESPILNFKKPKKAFLSPNRYPLEPTFLLATNLPKGKLAFPLNSLKERQRLRGFMGSKVLSDPLTFNMGDKDKSPKLQTESKEQVKNQRGRQFCVSESPSSLVGQRRRSNLLGLAFYSNLFKSGEFFGGSLVRADWVLDTFIEQLSKKKINPRSAMNQQINDMRILIDKIGSGCPIRGMRIMITGRLGSRKKAMAQQISKCIGKVPLSTFRQKVDYKQGFLPTRFGLVGIKIWVCYKNDYS